MLEIMSTYPFTSPPLPPSLAESPPKKTGLDRVKTFVLQRRSEEYKHEKKNECLTHYYKKWGTFSDPLFAKKILLLFYQTFKCSEIIQETLLFLAEANGLLTQTDDRDKCLESERKV